MRIMHITEALGGGVLNVLSLLADKQRLTGHEIMLVYSDRVDTPDLKTLKDTFFSDCELIKLDMVTQPSLSKDLEALIKMIRIIHTKNPDIIHLHSSKAGAIGRVACRLLGRSETCFYTPHSFAFLRRDVSKVKNSFFLWMEKLISFWGGTIVACSRSELEHARRTVGHKKSVLVENSVPVDVLPALESCDRDVLVIATSGRLCMQKHPKGFLELAVILQSELCLFHWIGGGELKSELLINGRLPDNISCSGWVTRQEVVQFLQATDIFVMTSLWEGMPLSLMEAQVMGLPAVVLNVEGCNDVVVHGETGFVCESVQEMADSVKLLLEDKELRLRMGKNARERSLTRFSPVRMSAEMMNLYKRNNRTGTD